MQVGDQRRDDVSRHGERVVPVRQDDSGVRQPADGEHDEDGEDHLALAKHLTEGRRLVAHGGAQAHLGATHVHDDSDVTAGNEQQRKVHAEDTGDRHKHTTDRTGECRVITTHVL